MFHAFHQHWIIALCDALNTGGLPSDYFALPEQRVQGPIPDVLTLQLSHEGEEASKSSTEEEVYASKADRVGVRHRSGEIVAVIEIISPGDKGSQSKLHAFVEKAAAFIANGVRLLVIDLFPPSKRDPQGIHKPIWDEFAEEDFVLPADKPLIIEAYDAGPSRVAYVEPVAVGDALPEIPLFLKPEFYVPAPLESTYQTSWDLFPAVLKKRLEGPFQTP